MMAKQARWIIVVGMALLTLVAALTVAAQGEPRALGFDVPVQGEITTDTPEALYIFEGTAGDVITVSMTADVAGVDSFLELLLPDGSTAMTDDDTGGNLNSLLGPYTLPQSGTYTVRATRFGQAMGGSAGPYTLLLKRVEPLALTPGEGVTVEVNAAQPFAFMTFAAADATSLYELETRAQEGDISYGISIRDGAGLFISQSMGNPDGSPVLLSPLRLDAGQEYLITLVRQETGPALPVEGSVRVAVTLRAIAAQPLSVGQAVSAALDDATPVIHYGFSGARGQVLRLEGSHAEGGLAIDVQVLGPNGGYVGSGNSAYGAYSGEPTTSFTLDPLVLDVSGEYIITVRMFDPQAGSTALPGSTARFTLALSETQAPLLQLGEAVTGLAEMSAPMVYRFEGLAGQAVTITLEGLDGAYTPAFDLQGPNPQAGQPGVSGLGYVLSANSAVRGAVRFDVTLPADGLYLFNVRTGGVYEMSGAPLDSAPAQFRLSVSAGQ